MAGKKNEKVGYRACKCCGHPAMVRKTATGTLTMACDGCDESSYAPAETDAYLTWMSQIIKVDGILPKEGSQKPSSEAPAATPPAQTTPLPAPPKAKPAGVFDFLGKGSAA